MKKRNLSILSSFILGFSLLSSFFLCSQQTFAQAETVPADEEDRIALDFQSPEDVTAADKAYGELFEGGEVKLRTSGYSDYYIPFLNSYAFQSLDLEMADANPDLYFELSDGTSGYLSDVQGLTKLKTRDYPGLYFDDAGVFSDLKELSLTEEYRSPYVFGRAAGESVPALETLKVYFKDRDNFDDQTKRTRGLFFPETLKTLELYEGDRQVSAETGVWPRLFAPLLCSCPDVIVNGKTLQEIKAYNDEYGYAFFEKEVRENILESLLYKTYRDVMLGRAEISHAIPVIGGRLVFMCVQDDEITSISSYDNELSVSEQYLAYDLDEMDTAIILFSDPDSPSAENPDRGSATKAVIADVKAGIVYPVQTLVPGSRFDPQGAADILLQSYNPSYKSSGTMTCGSLFDSAGISETTGRITDEMLTEILAILNNDVYRVTLEFLQGGEVVVPGSTGAPTAGVQQTLWDLGCPVGADGYAGPETFQGLNNMLAVYGKSAAEKVDAELYKELLAYLVLSTADEYTSRELLGSYFAPGEGSGEFDYIRACALYQKGLFYQAKMAFEQSWYRDYEYRAQSCAQPLPANGEHYHNGNYSSDAMILTFTVNSYDPSEGMLFQIYTQDGTHVSTLFVNGSGSVSTHLPGGIYRIRDVSGSAWYGWSDLFGADHPWEYMTFYEFEEDKYSTNLPAGYEWQISINVTEATGGSDVGSTSIPWD